jgi:hypothetical protein
LASVCLAIAVRYVDPGATKADRQRCTSGLGLRYPYTMKRRKHSPKTRRSSGEEPDADGLMVGNLLRQTVRDQIKANEPPEVAATYRRLIAEGHDDANALELITAVLAAEMYYILNEQRHFDEAKYNANLRRLPELPYDSDA